MSATQIDLDMARRHLWRQAAEPPAWRAVRFSSDGFTLIELMIVVAIVAILAAIAYPSYRDSVLKGRRAEGRTAVLDLLQQEERFFTQSNSYMSFGAGVTGANGSVLNAAGQTVGNQSIPFKTFSGDNPSNAAYNVGARTCTNTAFTLRECVEVFADTVVLNTDPKVGTLSATSTGIKDCSGTTKAMCWK